MTDPRALPERKLRILHVACASPRDPDRPLLELAREQAERGHAVGIVLDRQVRDCEGADFNRLASDLALGLRRLPVRPGPHPGDLVNAVRIMALARRLEADVVHGHGLKGGVFAGAAPRRGGDGPIRCYSPHVSEAGLWTFRRALAAAVERYVAAHTDVLFFNGVHDANCFHQCRGDMRAIVRLVPSSLRAEEWTPVTADADAADFLHVGELRASASLDALIEALAILQRRTGCQHTLALAGDGPDRPLIEARCRARGVADSVRFLGALPARRAFAFGRVLVVPGGAHPLSHLALEAAAAQVPMVASDVGGIGEVFGPYRDRLVATQTPLVLAAAMERLVVADPAAVAAETRDLAAYVSGRFTLDLMTGAVIAGYREAFAGRAAASIALERALPAHS